MEQLAGNHEFDQMNGVHGGGRLDIVLITNNLRLQVMDEYLNNRILELGVLNVTGFRVVQPHREEVKEFIKLWQKLDPIKWPWAGTDYLRVSIGFTGNIWFPGG